MKAGNIYLAISCPHTGHRQIFAAHRHRKRVVFFGQRHLGLRSVHASCGSSGGDAVDGSDPLQPRRPHSNDPGRRAGWTTQATINLPGKRTAVSWPALAETFACILCICEREVQPLAAGEVCDVAE